MLVEGFGKASDVFEVNIQPKLHEVNIQPKLQNEMKRNFIDFPKYFSYNK